MARPRCQPGVFNVHRADTSRVRTNGRIDNACQQAERATDRPDGRSRGTTQRIEVAGLRKRFGSTLALDGMTFTVPPGRVTGFVGPNGAGKSTTIRVILGLDSGRWRPPRWSAAGRLPQPGTPAAGTSAR